MLRRWHAGAHRHGTGVLGLAQPRGPGGVTVAVVKKEKPTSKSASFYLSVRGEGRNRADLAVFRMFILRVCRESVRSGVMRRVAVYCRLVFVLVAICRANSWLKRRE